MSLRSNLDVMLRRGGGTAEDFIALDIEPEQAKAMAALIESAGKMPSFDSPADFEKHLRECRECVWCALSKMYQ